MKKIAVMGSGNGSNFEAIVNFFKGKDVEIVCISDVEEAYILERAKKLNIEYLYLPFKKNEEFFQKNKFDLVVLAGYMRILSSEVLKNNIFINIHPSLLPAFKGKSAIKDAFLSGVKVSGITIHYVDKGVDTGKIIAQYPVFIELGMTLQEFEEAIHSVEHKLYPIVIEKVLEDKVFDFADLVKQKSSCTGGCSSCH